MKPKSKIMAVVLTIAIIVTQVVLLTNFTYAEESPKKVSQKVLDEAKQNRTPIVWYDFENVEPGATSVADRISGIVATNGQQMLKDGKPYQKPSPILTTDKYTLDGSAYWPNFRNDLLLPYEPLSQTGDTATIQFWVKMTRIADNNALFWAGPVKGEGDAQKNTFIGLFPRRGDNQKYTYFQKTKDKDMAKVAGDLPERGVWQLFTVTQEGNKAKVYLNDREIASGDVLFKMSDLLTQAKLSDNSLTMDDLKMGIGAFVEGWPDDTVYALIDDFKIFNVALNADEIKSEYESKKSKIDATAETYEVQLLGGEGNHDGFPVSPDFTRFYPSSLNVGRFTWGIWTKKTGRFYIKTTMKVEIVPGKENSDKPVGAIDRSGGEEHNLPAVKDFENGIWRPVVIEINNAPEGSKEYGFKATNRDEIYTIHYGPWVVVSNDDTPLELTDEQKAQNEARKSGANLLPDYKPADFNTEKGFVYEIKNLKDENFTHNPRAYLTVTANGNYLTTKRDLKDWFVWNGYMDRFGRKDPLPKGKYFFVFAYKAEGTAYDKDLDNDAQNKSNPALGLLDFPELISIPFGSEDKIDGKWHIEKIAVDISSDIPVNKEFRVRNFFNGGSFTLSLGPVYIMPYQNIPSVSLDKASYTTGEDIKVTFSNLDKNDLISGNKVSGMKIVKADGSDVEEGVSYWIDFPDEGRNVKDPNGSFTYSFNADGSDNKFKNLAPGQYKLLLEAEGKVEIMSVPFIVVEDAKVAEVINAISNLPEKITLQDEETIKAARKAYEELTAEQKAMVGSDVLAKLEAAEKALEELKNPGTQPPATKEPTAPPTYPEDTGDMLPIASVLLLLTGGAGILVFKKKELFIKNNSK